MSDIVRIGYGFDVHRLAKNRPLVLGGVEIPYKMGLTGHSDADVLLHAICDALLGSLALGDIGSHFPDDDPKYKNIDSRKLLEQVGELVRKKGFMVDNIDATVAAQQPKLAPHIDKMRATVASDLKIDKESVSVKATTTEGLGFVGRQEGISARAVVLVRSGE